MDQTQARELAIYAKELFQRSTDAQLASLRDMLMPFTNTAFARQCLEDHSHNCDDLSIPTVRGMLEMEAGRRMETAEQRKARAASEQQAIRDREDTERRRLAGGMKSVDELLDAMDDADLASLKADVVASFPIPCLLAGDPRKNVGLRRLMHYRMTKVQAGPRPQLVASNTLASEFDV